jgi:hypothetical protein
MLKQLWKKWTIDKPAAFGDLLWEIFVVQFAAWLDRLTLRRIIAFIPVVILGLAYYHSIPIPPELMLVGDVLAYIDIFSVILLLSILGRIATFWLFAKQAAEHAVRFAGSVLVSVQRFGLRRQREGNLKGRKRSTGRPKPDDEYPAARGFAWA